MAYVETKIAELEAEKIILQGKIEEWQAKKIDARTKLQNFSERMVKINILLAELAL
jgi:hypothetical protein